MYTIGKRFDFSASHQLFGLADGHPCMRLHGHNYSVELLVQTSVLDKNGFVVDYGDLKPFQVYIDTVLDHKHLNDVLSGPTTAENIAKHLYDVALQYWFRITVRVSETPKTWAEYHG